MNGDVVCTECEDGYGGKYFIMMMMYSFCGVVMSMVKPVRLLLPASENLFQMITPNITVI